MNPMCARKKKISKKMRKNAEIEMHDIRARSPQCDEVSTGISVSTGPRDAARDGNVLRPRTRSAAVINSRTVRKSDCGPSHSASPSRCALREQPIRRAATLAQPAAHFVASLLRATVRR